MKRKEEKQEKNKTNKHESELVTKESFSAVCALFSLIALLILATRSLIFGSLGIAVHSLLTGLFGYLAYPVLLGALYLSVTSLLGKRLVKNRKAGACIAAAFLCAALIVHTASTWSWLEEEGYILKCFYAGESFPAATAAGLSGAVLVYIMKTVTSRIGAIIVFSVLALFFAYLSVIFLRNRRRPSETAQTVQTAQSGNAADEPCSPVEIPLTQPQAQPQPQSPQVSQVPQYTQPILGQTETAQSAYRPQSMRQPTVRFDGNENVPTANAYGNAYGATVSQRPQVRLPDDAGKGAQRDWRRAEEPQTNKAFSPFGTPQTMRSEEERTQYQNSREFLFGATPAENYRRNLIFDPHSNVNKRPSVDPIADPQVRSGYTPSYSDAYQDALNGGEKICRPVKIVSDRVEEETRTDETPTRPFYGAYGTQSGQTIEPMPPIEQPKIAPQEPVVYDSYSPTGDAPISSYPTEESREDLFLRTERESTARENTANELDYRTLFSPSNSNIFGSEREERDFAEKTFSRGGETESESLFDKTADRREGEETRFEENVFGRGRDLSLNDEEISDRNGINIFDEDEEEEKTQDDPYTLRSDFESRRGGFDYVSRSREEETADVGTPEPPVAPAPKPAPPKPRVIKPYVKVPLDDFDCRDIEPTSNFEEIEETKANILATLEDFNVSGATIASVTNGPTVTRYNVTLPRSIPPKKVVALDQSIALSLHSSGVNIYPNYEDGVVSIEVPNKERQFVQLGCMLTGDTFVNAKPSSLMFAMGKDVGNRKVYGDVSKMIHLLVAGSSGSGKSVFLGSLIVSMIYKYSPEELRLILIDPKKTEFVLYNNLPHLMINEIITDVNKAVQSLNWAIGEMNRRYGLFEQMSRSGTYVVNLDGYNAHVENKADRLPKIVIIIDELADLMLAAKKEIEDRIQNLTQKARAAGIHLIVATQRPSTDVITGVIKSNLATRIAFAVATDVDSRVILDQSGAQNLLGKGDFLYTMQGINTPVRVQSAFISSEHSQRVVNFIKANNEAYYDESATAFINNARGESGGDSFGGGEEVEAVYIEALRYVIQSGSASISMIQRKCTVGYNKAGRIVEWMEDMGYISSFDGAKARKVLITKEEFESKYGTL